MGTLYTSEALRSYARRQIDCADTFLMIHTEAGLSLCRCGRLHPCDDRRYWLGIQEHYEQIIRDGLRRDSTSAHDAGQA
jgi:hypothetical protein